MFIVNLSAVEHSMDILRWYFRKLPENPKGEGHSDMKLVSSDWTLSVEQVEMQHCDQSSKAQQS